MTWLSGAGGECLFPLCESQWMPTCASEVRLPSLAARIGAVGGRLSTFQATKNRRFSYPQAIHKHLWKSCVLLSMLASRNEQKSSIGAGFSRVLLATMKAQQAVAIRFVGRRVTRSTCLFFVSRRVAHATLNFAARS
jgi:hypothetical protein